MVRPLLYFPRPVETSFSYPDPALGVPDPTLSRAARKASFLVLHPRAPSPLSQEEVLASPSTFSNLPPTETTS